jgi:hypothetical protein
LDALKGRLLFVINNGMSVDEFTVIDDEKQSLTPPPSATLLKNDFLHGTAQSGQSFFV